jgi:hypothetical protein
MRSGVEVGVPYYKPFYQRFVAHNNPEEGTAKIYASPCEDKQDEEISAG